MGVFDCWRNPVPHSLDSRNRYLAWNCMNPYLDKEEIKETFRNLYLEENYNFLEEDLVMLADAFIMAAVPMIIRTERDMCIKFVNTLNTNVARALGEYRENL
jgi:hypothetical protein